MSNENELKWVAYFRQFLGFRLVRSGKINPIFIHHINKAFKELGLRPLVISTETPISGSFLGGVFVAIGLTHKLPHTFYRPVDWLNAGVELNKPAYGCVAVVKTEKGEKVGIVVGKTKTGLLKVLAADQGDEINITDYNLENVLSFRWVGETDSPSIYRYTLPELRSGIIKSKLV